MRPLESLALGEPCTLRQSRCALADATASSRSEEFGATRGGELALHANWTIAACVLSLAIDVQTVAFRTLVCPSVGEHVMLATLRERNVSAPGGRDFAHVQERQLMSMDDGVLHARFELLAPARSYQLRVELVSCVTDVNLASSWW